MDQKDKARHDRELAALAWVMSDARGRAFVRRLLVECRVYGSVMGQTPGTLPEERVLYNAGKQDIGHFVVDEVALSDPSGKSYALMNQEAHNRLIIERSEREQKQKSKEGEE